MKQKQILVFGYFGYVTNQLDGQTIKTRAIYNLLKERSEAKISFADTQEFRSNKKSILLFIRDFLRCNTLVWLPAQNNLKFLFPLIWYASRIFRFEIIYIVIGGWLSTILGSLPFHKRRLKKIKSILVENHTTVKELEDCCGFKNLDVIPNFREIVPKPKIEKDEGELRLVFMARVNKMKGLDVIVEIAEHLKDINVTIDIYGPIFADDEAYFKSELIERFNSVKYCGVLQPEVICDTLRHYDVMLFPTHYYTEGFPGSIMDAYRSGLPVIATNWKHANEFIMDGISGYVVDFDKPAKEMVERINILYNDREMLLRMKEAAYNESLKYTPDIAYKVLHEYI